MQQNLVLWYIIIWWIVLWKDWIALSWSRSQKVQNSSECSSWWYLLSCWTFCNQTWYGDATSWAKVSCKKIGLLSSSSGSQWGLIWSNMTVSTISAELLIFLQPNSIGLPNRHSLNHSTQQWGAADAEIKVPSGENTELKRSPFKAWSRSVYSHTC